MPLVLGVDSSTSATKVEVRDADTGQLVASGRSPHPTTTPPRSEQDPAAWEAALATACAEAGADEPAVAAVAVAAQQHGMVVLDAAGEVVRPAKLWNDTESATDAASLIDQLDGGAAAWAAACGSVPTASFTITKLSWLRRVEPRAFARLATVLLPHDWLSFRMTGEHVTDRGDASGTGYWSPAEGRYRPDLLAMVDATVTWDATLPRVLGPGEPAGEWRGRIVAPGTGDNMAAALGLGVRAGDLVLSFGTSGTAYAVSDHPTADPTGAVAGFADATGAFLPLVCTLNATKVTDAFARLLAVDHDRFDDLALAAPPGAGGVTVVPYLDGERTPNRPDATGTVAGIRSDVTPELVARAAVEGVVCGLLDGVDALRRAGVEVDGGRVLVIGGGSRSRALRRVVADLLGRTVHVPSEPEHVALGACVQAAAVLTGRRPAEVVEAWSTGDADEIHPDPTVDRAAILDAYRAAASS